jgi:hypothetical protein
MNALASLSGSLLPGKEELAQFLEKGGIEPGSRAETVSIERFIRFAKLAVQNRPAPD